MSILWAILRRDIKELAIANPLIPLAIWAICALFALALPPGLTGTIPPFKLAISTGNNTVLAPILIATLEKTPLISEVQVCADDEELQYLVDNGLAQTAVFLPDDIENALINGGRVKIKIVCEDAVYGTLLYTLGRSAATAVNALQSTGNAYYTLARPAYSDNSEFYQSYLDFDRALLIDALTRWRLMDYRQPANPYLTQLTAILLFIMVSAGAICITAITAEQKGAGTTLRMRAHGSGLLLPWLAKMLASLLAAMILLLPPALAALWPGLEISLPKLLLSAAIISLISSPFYLLWGALCKTSAKAIGFCVVVMLAFLFMGGCLYPPYMMNFVLPTPAALAFTLAGWILC